MRTIKNSIRPKPLPTSPICVPSYEEEDAPTLVNYLIPEPTNGKKDTDKTEGDKTTEDRSNLIEVTNE